jgi:hypothetical protein
MRLSAPDEMAARIFYLDSRQPTAMAGVAGPANGARRRRFAARYTRRINTISKLSLA